MTSEGFVSAQLTEFFNLERTLSDYDVISLLFYMGWLTIKDVDEGLHNFQMPNPLHSMFKFLVSKHQTPKT